MKKIFSFLIIAVFIFACNPREDSDNNNKTSDTVELINNQEKSDTNETKITPEEANQKSEEILEKTKNINKRLDSILNN